MQFFELVFSSKQLTVDQLSFLLTVSHENLSEIKLYSAKFFGLNAHFHSLCPSVGSVSTRFEIGERQKDLTF